MRTPPKSETAKTLQPWLRQTIRSVEALVVLLGATTVGLSQSTRQLRPGRREISSLPFLA
ncbi:hypothetical protein [Rhodococcus sp. IEGM 1374]|uniref:hypothetical protein n=1 Tax=Rhodococcus sp. IEGM 1374 TaxID=3082221 RepID=UPI003988AF92